MLFLGLAKLRVRHPGAAAQQADEADGRLRRPQLIGEALGGYVKHPIVLNVPSGDHVEAALPGRYRSLVTASMRKGGPATLVIFGDAIARLRQVESALANITASSASTVLAFANDITAEAKERLEDAGAVVCTLRGFGWREERHPALRSKEPPN